MNLESTYIFNPYYIIKPDRHRVILSNSGSFFIIPEKLAEDAITSFIHPMFGIIISVFDGKKTLSKCIDELADYFDCSFEEVLEIIKKLINNKGRVGFLVQGFLSEFPKNILIEYKEEYKFRDYDKESFAIIDELDFTTARLYEGPLDVSILVNTICATDCEYCYVDRRIKQNCLIPLERLLELIQEAKKMGVRKFDIAGTEIFMYKHWDVLVKKLLENDYYPYLSTKLPLSGKSIKKLYELGIRHLQVSMDSLDNETISKLWGIKVEEYINRLMKSLYKISNQGIELKVNSVITNTNFSISNLEKLLLTLNNIKSLKEVIINEAGASIAKTESQFKKFRLNTNQSKTLEKFIADFNQSKKLNYKLGLAKGLVKSDFVNEYSVKKELFLKRSTCPAGIRSLTILNDGQVTICEELYWNKNFIIGNVLEQSIFEIWNSKKAKYFGNLKPSDFKSEGFCTNCPEFNNCRKTGEGVCWSQVIQAYGEKNWKYPDPSCPNAPSPFYEIYNQV